MKIAARARADKRRSIQCGLKGGGVREDNHQQIRSDYRWQNSENPLQSSKLVHDRPLRRILRSVYKAHKSIDAQSLHVGR